MPAERTQSTGSDQSWADDARSQQEGNFSMNVGLLRVYLANFEDLEQVYRGPDGIIIIQKAVSGCAVIDLPPCPEIPTGPTALDLFHDYLIERLRSETR
jgi:hypothetical protein